MTTSRRRRSVILISGGLDSAANLALCSERDEPILGLTADYGQRAASAEIRAGAEFCRHYEIRHQTLDLRWLGSLGGSSLTDTRQAVPRLATDQLDTRAVTEKSAQAVWVPNRNGVLIAAAAAYAERLGAEQVVVGFNREEAATFPDNSLEFLSCSTRALELSTANHVAVHSYTAEWDKRQIVAALRRLSPPFPFEMIWSCYQGGSRPCGACESCRRLARALAAT